MGGRYPLLVYDRRNTLVLPGVLRCTLLHCVGQQQRATKQRRWLATAISGNYAHTLRLAKKSSRSKE